MLNAVTRSDPAPSPVPAAVQIATAEADDARALVRSLDAQRDELKAAQQRHAGAMGRHVLSLKKLDADRQALVRVHVAADPLPADVVATLDAIDGKRAELERQRVRAEQARDTAEAALIQVTTERHQAAVTLARAVATLATAERQAAADALDALWPDVVARITAWLDASDAEANAQHAAQVVAGAPRSTVPRLLRTQISQRACHALWPELPVGAAGPGPHPTRWRECRSA